MTYVVQDNLAHDSVFLQRIRVAMVTAATNIQAEDPGTTNHTNRSNYAKLVLNTPDGYMQAFSDAVVSNVAITSASTDSDLQFTVNSLWNAMCGTI